MNNLSLEPQNAKNVVYIRIAKRKKEGERKREGGRKGRRRGVKKKGGEGGRKRRAKKEMKPNA